MLEATAILLDFISPRRFDEKMKLVLALISFVLCGAAPTFAQYTAFKSADGVLLISNRPGQYFSVDLPAAKIIPVGASQAPHPYFLIYDRATMKREEGRLVQVMPVPLAEFKGTASANDETLLRQQADYEIQYWHPRHSSSRLTSLTNGRAALLWSLTIAKKLPAGNEQLYLSLRQNDYVLVLSSNLPPG